MNKLLFKNKNKKNKIKTFFIQQESIKLIISDSKGIYKVAKA